MQTRTNSGSQATDSADTRVSLPLPSTTPARRRPRASVIALGWVLMVGGCIGAFAGIAVSRATPEGNVAAMAAGAFLGVCAVAGFCLLAAVDDRWPAA